MFRYLAASLSLSLAMAGSASSQDTCTTVLECTQLAVEAAQLANERLDVIESRIPKIQSGYIEPDAFEVSKFRDPSDSLGPTGCISGDAAHRGIRSRVIRFDESFSESPSVVLGVSELTSQGPVRLTASYSALSNEGFTARITTYCDTKVFDIKIHWIAYGY